MRCIMGNKSVELRTWGMSLQNEILSNISSLREVLSFLQPIYNQHHTLVRLNWTPVPKHSLSS